MGVLSNRIEIYKLKPGDHIYTWRNAYLYSHHGIFVDDGNVIHFTPGAGQNVGIGKILDRFLWSSIPKSVDNPCSKCGHQAKLHGVISSCIDCFLCGGDLNRFEYGVSPAFFVARARGGATLALSDPPKEVVHRASFLLENGFGVYDIFENNCEDFAMYCKTGLLVKRKNVGRSGQAASFFAACSSILSSSRLRFLTYGTPGLAASCAVYSVRRWVSDMGVRGDVEKVPVETMVSRLNESRVTTEMAK